MRAFKGIAGFAGGDSRSWVLTIVRNTSYAWLARNRPAALVLAGDLDDKAQARLDQADPDPTPEARLIARAEAETVRQAMAALPAPFREVLVLREIHELSYKAIADIAGVPIGTVIRGRSGPAPDAGEPRRKPGITCPIRTSSCSRPMSMASSLLSKPCSSRTGCAPNRASRLTMPHAAPLNRVARRHRRRFALAATGAADCRRRAQAVLDRILAEPGRLVRPRPACRRRDCLERHRAWQPAGPRRPGGLGTYPRTDGVGADRCALFGTTPSSRGSIAGSASRRSWWT